MPRRSKTPGVRIVERKRADGVTYYGRWRDELTGEWSDINLTRMGLTTESLRKRWLQRKAEELQARRRAMALGVSITTHDEAARRYLDECRRRLRRRSVDAYEHALEVLVDFLRRLGRVSVEETTPSDLWALRSALVQRIEDQGTLTNAFKRTRAALGWWRRAQLLPLLSSDTIADAFRGVTLDSEEIRPLKPPEVRALLVAAVAHRNVRLAAMIAVDLLTGLRGGELAALAWDDLEAEGDHPCIRLGSWTKTRRARTVDLSIAPAAVAILSAMPRVGSYVFSAADEPLSPSTVRNWRTAFQPLSRPWTFRLLRQTAGSYMANAPGLWGGASAYRTARQLGHSVSVSEKFYLGVLPGIPAGARLVESAMEAEAEFAAIAARARTESEVDRESSCDTRAHLSDASLPWRTAVHSNRDTTA